MKRTAYDPARELTYILPVVDRRDCKCEACNPGVFVPSIMDSPGFRRFLEDLEGGLGV